MFDCESVAKSLRCCASDSVDTLNSSFGSYVKFSDLVRGAPVIVPSNKEETE